MRISVLILLIFLTSCFQVTFGQEEIELKNIEIVRDTYGVPHIFTKTNREAVYGIAWAQCEDNFHLVQDNISFSKGLGGRLMGKTGVALDYIYEAFQIHEFVEERYNKDIGPEIEDFLKVYVSAVNKYAEENPNEVKHKDLFPINEREVLGTHLLHMLLMHSSSMELGKLLSKEFAYALIDNEKHGSNAMAFSPSFTEDEKTYLIGNPHQPVNEMGNFWELSVHTEEGYEMYGAMFSVGGLFPTIGANRQLAWSHTTNYQNSADVYQLEMHPLKKNFYKYDDKWLELEAYKAKLKVKLGFLNIPIKKKYYRSVYGPTFKKGDHYFAFKSHVFHNLKLPEQWYKMGLAKNIEEFEEALSLQGLAAQTVTYADKDGNIFHLSNFTHPYRSEEYAWSEMVEGNTVILPGNTSKNNWSLEKIHPIEDLPQVKNPNCGYVYNCNNTVYKMTAPDENPKAGDFPNYFGLLESNSLRANTFERLIMNHEKISFEEAREIRENVTVQKNKMSFRNCTNCDDIPNILAKYPSLYEAKNVFDKWDGSFEIDNKQASLMCITSMYFAEYVTLKMMGNEEKEIPEEIIVESLLKAQKFLKKHYGTLEVPLGQLQKAVRYDVELPMYGGSNTLANTHVAPHKGGQVKIVGGDSFIFYAKFGQNGLEQLETINAFGNSLKEGHPHSTDQTEMYVNMQTKDAILDLETLKKVGKAYHPK